MNLNFLCDGERRKVLFRQIFRFALVGLSNTIVGYGIYCLFLALFRKMEILPGIDYLIAQAVAFVLGVLWSYYWNNRVVFVEQRSKIQVLTGLMKAYAMYVFTGLILSDALLVLWVRIFDFSAYLGPLLNMVITVPLNFVLSKLWVYRSSEKKSSDSCEQTSSSYNEQPQ